MICIPILNPKIELSAFSCSAEPVVDRNCVIDGLGSVSWKFTIFGVDSLRSLASLGSKESLEIRESFEQICYSVGAA